MSNKIGLDCKVYRSATALASTAYSGATWIEEKNVKNVSMPATKGRADMSTRASQFRQNRGTLKDIPITLSVVWDPDDGLCAALLSSFLNNTPIAMAFLDGDEGGSNSQGWAGNWECMDFPRTEELEEGVIIEAVVEPRQFTGWYYTGS